MEFNKFNRIDYLLICIGGVAFYVGGAMVGTGDPKSAVMWVLGGLATRFIMGRTYK
jgi:hypothetical protein